jgi:hypothetical protein
MFTYDFIDWELYEERYEEMQRVLAELNKEDN